MGDCSTHRILQLDWPVLGVGGVGGVGGMIQPELYIYLALAALLLCFLPAAVFYYRMPRNNKKEVLMEMGSMSMGLPMGFPRGTVGSQTVVQLHSNMSRFGAPLHRSLPPVVAQQQPLETVKALESGLPSYGEAMKSRWADTRLDCHFFAGDDKPQDVPASS